MEDIGEITSDVYKALKERDLLQPIVLRGLNFLHYESVEVGSQRVDYGIMILGGKYMETVLVGDEVRGHSISASVVNQDIRVISQVRINPIRSDNKL